MIDTQPFITDEHPGLRRTPPGSHLWRNRVCLIHVSIDEKYFLGKPGYRQFPIELDILVNPVILDKMFAI